MNPAKSGAQWRRTALFTFLYRDVGQTIFTGTWLGRTYIGIPLEVLVDEPEGRDGSYQGEEARHEPSDIMRYNGKSIVDRGYEEL